MILTKDEILFLLRRLSQETVVEPTKEFPYTVSREWRGGYQTGDAGKLQAKLSIMLEMAVRKGE